MPASFLWQSANIVQQTNPRRLKGEIYDLIDHVFSLPLAVPGQPEDVHLTLTTSPLSQKGEGTSVTFSFDRTIPVG